MDSDQSTLGESPAPPTAQACNHAFPCPIGWGERISSYAEQHREELVGSGYDSLHRRFHEIYDHQVHVDEETASYTGAWAATLMELSHDKRDAAAQAKGQSWEFEEGRSIVWRPSGIELQMTRANGDQVRLPVISGFLKPLRQVSVEGWTYFEVAITPTQKVTASAEDILKRLERDGRIRKRKLGHDVLVEVLHELAPAAGLAFPCYGIYARETGELEICTSPVPIRDEQLIAHQEIETGLAQPVRAEDLGAYFEFIRFFHPYEVFPSMGYGALAPVAHTLRGRDVFVGHVWNWSLGHGLGKSLVSRVFSKRLWGRSEATGSGINSEFRLAAHFDAACVTQCVEEGENLSVHRLSPDFKTSAERSIVTRRGSTLLTMAPYASRAVLLISGNRNAFRSGPSLSRVLAPRFDSSQASARREQKPQVDLLTTRLQPVGHFLAEQLVTLHPRLESLLYRIRDLEAEIAKTGAATGDIRRAQMWAANYVGLEVWAAAAKALGVDWSPPPIAEFVARVVVPVDDATYSGEESVVEAFRSWFESWRTRNTKRYTRVATSGGREDYRHEEEVAGRGDLFMDGELQIRGKRVEGWFIAKALTVDYNRTAAPDLQIGSLQDLAIASADEAGIPHSEVLEEDGKVRRVDFVSDKRRRVRAAFVPRVHPSDGVDEEGV